MPSLPTDTTPLRLAVIHALTQQTAQPQALPAANLFRLGLPKDGSKGPRAAEVLTPLCYVLPIQDQPIAPELRMTDRARIAAEVEIRCWYYGHDLHTGEWEAMVARAERDKRLVADALTYPSALYVAPNGIRTGLDGGSLQAGDRLTIDGPLPEQNNPRVYRVTFRFRADVELTRAT